MCALLLISRQRYLWVEIMCGIVEWCSSSRQQQAAATAFIWDKVGGPSRIVMCQRRRRRVKQRIAIDGRLCDSAAAAAFYVFNYLIKARRWDNRKQQFYISFQFCFRVQVVLPRYHVAKWFVRWASHWGGYGVRELCSDLRWNVQILFVKPDRGVVGIGEEVMNPVSSCGWTFKFGCCLSVRPLPRAAPPASNILCNLLYANRHFTEHSPTSCTFGD